MPLASLACQTMQPPTIKRQSQNWHTIPPTADKPLYSIKVNHLATMNFNPFSDRKSDQKFDETDWIGGTLLIAAILLLSGLLVNKVMTKESELKYLDQNNCKINDSLGLQ